MRRIAETTAHGNRVQLLHDGEECLPAMLRAIEASEMISRFLKPVLPASMTTFDS